MKKQVLVFRPGHEPAVEQMDVVDMGTTGAEAVWLSQKVGGYLRALVLADAGLVLFTRDESRLKPNRTMPGGLVVHGTAVLVGSKPPKSGYAWTAGLWDRRSLTPEEIAKWSSLPVAPVAAEIVGGE